jgi:hypothetical protein
VDGLFALPRQLLENSPAGRIGKSAEHGIGIGQLHTQTITKQLCIVKFSIAPQWVSSGRFS